MITYNPYFLELQTKRQLLADKDFSLYGFFQKKISLIQMFEHFGKIVSHTKEIHIRIRDINRAILLEDQHFLMVGKKMESADGDRIDFLDKEQLGLFISKYFDIQDENQLLEHYVAEVRFFRQSQDESIVLVYFSNIQEFSRVMALIAKKIDQEGTLQLVIDHLKPFVSRLAIKSFKVLGNGTILMPGQKIHYLDLKNSSDLERFCLDIWENDMTDSKALY